MIKIGHLYKILTVVGLLWLPAAGGVAANSGYILLKSGKKLVSDDITSDIDGNMFYLTEQGSMIVPGEMIKYALVKKPAELLSADNLLKNGRYTESEALYATAAIKYKHLGWYAYAITGQLSALHQQGRHQDIGKIIKPLLSYRPPNVEHEQHFILQAYRIYAGNLLHDKQYKAIAAVLHRLKSGNDAELSAWAFNISGKRLFKQQKYREAAREFIQPVLLYDKKNRERRDAMRFLTACLAQFDKKLSNFYLKRLKKEYNDSTLPSYH